MSKWRADPSFLQWGFVTTLANNDISKVIAAIPIVGYFILFNDGFAKAISFDVIAGHAVADSSPFFFETITKLRLAFFGSILVLLGNLIVRIRGPKVLSNSANDLEFCERVVGSYSQSEIIEIEKQILASQWKLRTPLLLEESLAGFAHELGKRKPKLSGFREKKHAINRYPEYFRSLAREWWAGQMHINPLSRYLTLVLTSVGYLMLSIPTIDILQAVIRDLIN